MPNRTWTSDNLRDMGARRTEGKTWGEIGEAFGVGADVARGAYRRRAGASPPEPNCPVPEFPDWDIPEDVDWRELYELD